MNFLAPAFLAGLAVIAAPLIAHLIRRATRARFAFSSLRFLDESPPRLDRRSRIEHPWLLLLRALVVAVLALAFSRPYWSDGDNPAAAATVARHVVVLVDTSASMQRSGLREAAIARAQDIVASARPADQFSIAAVSADTRWLVSAESWRATPHEERRALVHAALASLEPGWQSAHLDAAAEDVILEWERMAEADGAAGQRELVIVSDFASGTRTAGLAEIEWPTGARVELARLEAANTGNAGIEWLGWTTAVVETSGRPEQPARRPYPAFTGSSADSMDDPPHPTEVPAARLRVSRSFDLAEAFAWTATNPLTGESVDILPELELLPGGTQVITVPWPDPALQALRIDLEVTDAADFDNRLWIARPPVRHVRLVYLGEHDTADPGRAAFYLARAVGGIREPVVEFEMTTSPVPTGAGVWVIDGALEPDQAAAARRHVESGGTVLWLNPASAGSGVSPATLERVSGIPGWRALASARADAMFGQIDFQHPLFAPFADPRFSDFTRIRFWRPQPIEAPDDESIHVVARFDDETPAIIEQAIGRGRMILWGGGWAPDDGQWVLSSKFVPWLVALIERTAGGSRLASMADVDDPRRVLARDRTSTHWNPIDQATDSAAGAPPVVPGIYDIDTIGGILRVALNVPAAESRLDPLPLDTWEQLGVPIAADAEAGESIRAALSMEARAVEGRQNLWRGLLWAAVAILALESLVSIWLSRSTRYTAAPARS